MRILPGVRPSALLLLLTLLAGLVMLPGCLDNLCKLRLYLYRDVEQKSLPPSDLALLIADPALVAALLPAAKLPPVLPWAPEQPNYDQDYYQLSIDQLDGRVVYQGRCMNTTPTYVCEVRPGNRRVMATLNLFGPSGRESIKGETPLTLEPGAVYFLYPDASEASQKRLRLQAQRLPAPYDAELRAKLMDWLHHHTQGRSLED
ncbi:MAG: hypothetical protein M0P73_13155 [Syntrophobacterales bacterium]|nr:hypothetical protein [Syntrophobacterales bacterium]